MSGERAEKVREKEAVYEWRKRGECYREGSEIEGGSTLVKKERRKLQRRQHISGEREEKVREKAVYEWRKRGGS